MEPVTSAGGEHVGRAGSMTRRRLQGILRCEGVGESFRWRLRWQRVRWIY